MMDFEKQPIPHRSEYRLNARKDGLREFFGWGGIVLGVWVELVAVRPSKRIFVMGDFSLSGWDGERRQKNNGDIGIKLPHFPLGAQRFPDDFHGWVAPATKRGCIATYKRALRKNSP